MTGTTTVAIVTGASRGIGRAIALQLADDGMDVAINDIEQQQSDLEAVKKEILAKGRRSICVIADVSKEDQVQNMVKATVEEFGELNVMVANAGILNPKPLLELSLAEWEKVLSINTTGTFLCYREAAHQMISQGKGGKIVGACSIAGYRSTGGHSLAYSASKWAVRGLTQGTALELAKYNINVNAYCPGPVATNMWDTIAASMGGDDEAKGAAFKKSVEERAALKRPSEPEDIANLVSFLASPRARNITGQSMICDGGIQLT